MTEPAELVARILFEGGAIHPDAGAKGLGLVVVGVPDDLWKLEHGRISEYLHEHRTLPALEASRRVLWSRTQAHLEERWIASGRPTFVEDGGNAHAYELLDEVWRENRQGLRLGDFPRALRTYRAAMLAYVGKEPTP